ncbi:hypothetical protein PPE03_12710 [Pseudoalteromonas peptidolytica]|nr:hypothetical protein PPE03_12710 [Pseudoalteromonas peptidolytica]
MDFMTGVALAIAFLIAIIAAFIDKIRLGKSIFLSRRIADRSVAKSLGLNSSLLLLYSMIIYNSIGMMGGVLFASSNNLSSVSFLGAIAPGLAAMFIVKAAKEYATLPSNRKLSSTASGFSHWIVKKTDSIGFIVVLLVILSVVITLVRFKLREFEMSLGMLNAFTAIGTFFVWGLIGVVAQLSGKSVKENLGA